MIFFNLGLTSVHEFFFPVSSLIIVFLPFVLVFSSGEPVIHIYTLSFPFHRESQTMPELLG